MAVPKEKSRQKTTPVSYLYQADGTIGEITDAKARDRIAKADGEIDALDGRVTTAETNITTLDNELSTYVRPNLLDNWYFVGGGSQLGYGVFPINQRGQTTYSGDGAYHIDRWINYNMSSLTINNDGITIVSSSQGFVAIQHVADATAVKSFAGKKLTASVLYASVSGGTAGIRIDCGNKTYSSTDISTSGLTTATGTVSANATKIDVNLRFQSGVTAKVVAVKLELGDTQTLAHQENGVWVLNEIPDYEYQLIKCNTSKADVSDTYANKDILYNAITSQTVNVNNGYEYLYIVFEKLGKLVNARVNIKLTSNATVGIKTFSNAIPSAFRPRNDPYDKTDVESTVGASIERNDTGIQGQGTILFFSDGTIKYGVNTQGVSGVWLTTHLTYFAD